MKGKLLLLSLLMLAFANNAMGERLAFGEAQTDNSAEGLVYASEAEMNIEDITGWSNYSAPHRMRHELGLVNNS